MAEFLIQSDKGNGAKVCHMPIMTVLSTLLTTIMKLNYSRRQYVWNI